jgi:hypothetical protein
MFGNNSNLWMQQIVTYPNLIQYIADLSPNIIRAPAGSVSDVYFWDGTAANPAPADVPDSIYTNGGTLGPTGPWYGGNTQSWTLSLSNYYSMLASVNSPGNHHDQLCLCALRHGAGPGGGGGTSGGGLGPV